MTPARVLLVDDDEGLRRSIARALQFEGYAVELAGDGVEALEFFADGLEPPDAVILDVLMPRMDGLATCRRIRELSDVPVLMLTARHSVADRVDGLETGADHYLGKPFAVVELLARLNALIRRSATPTTGEVRILRYADLELNTGEHRVYRSGHRLDLTRIEFSLLETLMSHPHLVLSRSAIFAEVWGYELEYSSNSLDAYIGFVRRKTEAFGAPRLIQTVRGIGYVLRDESQP
jgi:two-component system response regulator MprA